MRVISEHQAKTIEERCHRAELERDSLKAQVEELKGKLDSEVKRIMDVERQEQARLINERDDAKAKLGKLDADHASVARQLHYVQVEYANLRAKLLHAEKDVESSLNQVRALQQSVKEIQAKLATVEAEKNELVLQLAREGGRAVILEADAACMREVLRDAEMEIEAHYIDWSKFQEGPDHDSHYKPDFPEIVSRCASARKVGFGQRLLDELANLKALLENHRQQYANKELEVIALRDELAQLRATAQQASLEVSRLEAILREHGVDIPAQSGKLNSP